MTFHQQVIADLKALGIDSPQPRWFAVRDYLAELRADHQRAINRIWLVATFFDLAEANAHVRGEPVLPGRCGCGETLTDDAFETHYTYWLCDQPIVKVPHHEELVLIDFQTARAEIMARYTGKARARAREIVNDFIPKHLREIENGSSTDGNARGRDRAEGSEVCV